MKSPIVLAIASMIFYVISNNLLEQKFAKYNTFTLLICYVSVVLAMSTIGYFTTKTSDPSFCFPTGWNTIFVIALGAIMFLADSCYVGAYTAGRGDLITITCITVMFPVVAAGIKFAITKSTPGGWHIAGFILAATAVICITKGSQQAAP